MTFYISKSSLIIHIHVAKLSAINDSEISEIQLPAGVAPTGDRAILIPVMMSNWRPTDKIAYLNFSEGKQKARIRFSVDSMTNIVLMGCYVFPRSHFNIS